MDLRRPGQAVGRGAAFAALAVASVFAASLAQAQQPPAPAQTPAPQTPTPQATPAPDPKAILESVCSSCHGVDFITERKKTRDGWDATVHRMIDKGADLDQESAALLVDYLAKTYPAPDAPPAPTPG